MMSIAKMTPNTGWLAPSEWVDQEVTEAFQLNKARLYESSDGSQVTQFVVIDGGKAPASSAL